MARLRVPAAGMAAPARLRIPVAAVLSRARNILRAPSMNVLLLGSGGREHALAAAIAKSPRLTRLIAAPGNPGIARRRVHHCKGDA